MIRKVMLLNPNYTWLGGRTWMLQPIGLIILKSQLERKYDTVLYDANFSGDTIEQSGEVLLREAPDIVMVTSSSTDRIEEVALACSIVRDTLPHTSIILGGVIPTVLPETVSSLIDADIYFGGEADTSVAGLVDGMMPYGSYRTYDDYAGNAIVEDLDLPLPITYDNIIGYDGGITLLDYGMVVNKYSPGSVPAKFPYSNIISSRGCPIGCCFCAAETVSGKRMRFRSHHNVCSELKMLYDGGIRSFIFLDDHFLARRSRAIDIMSYIGSLGDATWKAVNVSVWSLDEETMEAMLKSGCNFITVSLESGVQRVIDEIIGKPVDIQDAKAKLRLARSMGFDIVVNFVIGFPDETYNEVMSTVEFASSLDVDLVNFHIATPLPKTRLERECIERGIILPNSTGLGSGYTVGSISTNEFTAEQITDIRYREWDRINFSSDNRKRTIARLCGITMEELEAWRIRTNDTRGNTTATMEVKA